VSFCSSSNLLSSKGNLIIPGTCSLQTLSKMVDDKARFRERFETSLGDASSQT
jgi:hypothetical protein